MYLIERKWYNHREKKLLLEIISVMKSRINEISIESLKWETSRAKGCLLMLLLLLFLNACSSNVENELQSEQSIPEEELILAEDLEKIDSEELIEEITYENVFSFLGNWYSGLGGILPIFNQVREIEFLPDGTVIILRPFGTDGKHERTWEISEDGTLIVDDWVVGYIIFTIALG